MMDSVIYVNVDTQTSFPSSTTTDEDDEIRESEQACRLRNTSNQLETIEERLHGNEEEEDDEEETDPTSETRRTKLRHQHPCDSQHSEQIVRAQDEEQSLIQKSSQIEEQQSQLTVLRDLLRIERQKNQQRKFNNESMQQYLNQIQSDYLALQRELVETLELAHKVKAQKEAQISALDETLREKNKLIEQLKENLSNLDESKVRAEFKELMERQNKLAQLEREQLKEQIEQAEQQLMRERINNSQLLQQFQTRLEEQMAAHESESAALKKKLTTMEADYERLLNEPNNMIIKNLKEEKSRLSCQLDELSLVLSESQTKYDCLRRRIEDLLSEQEQFESKNQTEMERLQQQCSDQRRAYNEVKIELENREELLQIAQFNLQRSEKRVKNLLHVLKGKEETYNGLISQMNGKHEQELDRLISDKRSMERKLMDCQSELDRKQNELMKHELERDNQLDSIRNDRDERLTKLNQDKLRLDNQLKLMELKFAREFEDKEHKSKLVEQYQKELQYFKEESKRLSIELTKAEAKLYNKDKELMDLSGSREDLMQHDKMQQFEEIGLQLEEAKRHSRRLADTIGELKTENEKLRMKLKVNETNLAKISASMSKEHSKMLHEYETRLEQIKSEQSLFDRNKIKYKRYGYKLRKYCDHLRRVHEHMCNPSVCGYIISPTCPSSTHATPRKIDSDKYALFSSDDEQDFNDQHENVVGRCLTPIKAKKHHEKFLIKKTGTAGALSPLFKSKPISNHNNSQVSHQPPISPRQSILKPILNKA